MAKRSTRPKGADGTQPDDDFLREVGGKRIALGPAGQYGETWNFGWIPPENRTEVAAEAACRASAEMPRFVVDGPTQYPGRGRTGGGSEPERVNLYEAWTHPDVVEANGYEFTGVHQLTGSCVGAGGGNCWFTLGCMDVIKRSDAEAPLLPFWLLPYGRSRFYLGDRGPGEGSTGSTFAKAAREDGVVPADPKHSPGLPPFTRDDGFVWGRSVEMKWSDGDNSDTMALLPASRKHLVQTTAQCRSASDVREAIVNGYPCTCASMYAHNGGRVQGTGKNAVLLASRSGSWAHQMSLLAWWMHPEFGELFWLMNQWGLRAHGQDPAGGPAGGVWIKASDVDWICRDEVFAFSQFGGFPAPAKPLSWVF
jgi:hypothetical protein